MKTAWQIDGQVSFTADQFAQCPALNEPLGSSCKIWWIAEKQFVHLVKTQKTVGKSDTGGLVCERIATSTFEKSLGRLNCFSFLAASSIKQN